MNCSVSRPLPHWLMLAIAKRSNKKKKIESNISFSHPPFIVFFSFFSRRISRQASIAINAFRIITGRTVYCQVYVRHVYHVNVMQSVRLVCAHQLAVRARVKRVSLDQSVINVPADIVEQIVRNVHVMFAARCQVVNVKRIVNAK